MQENYKSMPVMTFLENVMKHHKMTNVVEKVLDYDYPELDWRMEPLWVDPAENAENENSENIINNNNNNNNNNIINPSVTINYELWACIICKTNQSTGIIIPCRHLCICLDCELIVLKTKKCPTCAGVCTATMYFPTP
jgi:hypothetical protein